MEYLGKVPDREQHTVVRMTGREYEALCMLVDSVWGRQGAGRPPVSRQDVTEFLEAARKIIEGVPCAPVGLRAPILHTHIEDVLPDDHPLAFGTVYCEGPGCSRMLHAFNNECMQTWVETGKGNFCIWCFMRVTGPEGPEVLEEEWGLKEEEHE